jgi:NifU-like protein involved in Fe-S cluster formation
MADYIERGLRRRRLPPLACEGDLVEDDEGRSVRFSLAVEDGVVRDARFSAAICTALVAYAELIVSRIVGLSLRDALLRSQPADLLAAFPQVPPAKRRAAQVACAGLLSAVRRAVEGESR